MACYDYQIAKDVLSDNDKNRLVCLYLNRRPPGDVDWDKATTEFKCASVSSMKTSTYNILKKIENAGGKVGTTASPTPKKGGGKKRKASPVDGEDDEEATPITKKKGRKSKKMAETPVDFNTEDAAVIKGEPTSEGDGEGEASA